VEQESQPGAVDRLCDVRVSGAEPAGSRVEPMDHIEVIRAESRRFAEVLAHTAPDAPCPTCPDWTASDLLWHLVEVHEFWASILETGATTDEQMQAIEDAKPQRPGTLAEMLAARERATERLCHQLARLSDREARWTWWPADQTVGFTRRMQVCEATMHRVDAELAAGVRRTAISREVAVALVNQCVDHMWAWIPDWSTQEMAGVVELLAADTGQRWVVEVGHWTGVGPQSGKAFDVPCARRAAPDAVSSAMAVAPVVDLALWAWSRGGVVQRAGDEAVVKALDAVIAEGVQ